MEWPFHRKPGRKLAEDLGHVKGQEGFLLSQVGQKKEEWKRRRKRSEDGTCSPWGQQKEKGGLHIRWRERAASMWQQDRVRPVHGVLTSAMPTSAWEGVPAADKGSGCWNVGFGEQTQAEDCSWLWGDIRGTEWGRSSANRNAWGGSLSHHSAGALARVMPKAKTHHRLSLSPLCWPLLTRQYEGLPPGWVLSMMLVAASLCALFPYQHRLVGSGKPGAGAYGSLTCMRGLKTLMEIKEVKLKSSTALEAAQTVSIPSQLSL